MSELRNTADGERTAVVTGHLIYEEKIISNRPVKREAFMDDNIFNQMKSHQNKYHKMDVLIDVKGRNLKIISIDLRDLNDLMKDYNLPDYAVSESKSYLFKDNIEMYLPSVPFPGQKYQVGLVEPPGNNVTFDMLLLGVIEKHNLMDDKNPVLSTVEKDGKKLLRETITTARDGGTYKTTIDCDPQLGYRFSREEVRFDDRLVGETIADHYMDVNGVSYPFVFIYRAFDKNGGISYERIWNFEKVELNISVSADDFKILIPSGASINDSVVYKGIYELKDGGYMGISDIMGMGAIKSINP